MGELAHKLQFSYNPLNINGEEDTVIRKLAITLTVCLLIACGGSIKTVDKELPSDLDFYNPSLQAGGLRLTALGDNTVLLPMTGTTKTFAPNADALFAAEQGKLFAREQSIFNSAFDIPAFIKRTVNPGSTVIIHFLVPYAPSVNDDLKTLAAIQDEMGKDKITVFGVYFVDIEREKKEPAVISEEAAAFGIKHPEIPIYQTDLSVVKKLGPFEDFPHTIIVSPHARIIGDYAGPIKKDKLLPLLGL
jgi:hypothetical protein